MLIDEKELDEKNSADALYNYLTREEDFSMMESFLKSINFTFTVDCYKISHIIKSSEMPNKEIVVKKGKEGLRKLVLIFLSECIKMEDGEIELFSDQDMAWMAEDENFFKTWQLLMVALLKSGKKIKMIHHIKRDNKGISKGIEAWLPLHLSGNIDSFVSMKEDPFVANTVFLNKTNFTISGHTLRGMEDESNYSLSKNPLHLKQSEAYFSNLLNNAIPLVSTWSFSEYKDFLVKEKDLFGFKDESPIFTLQKNLPIYTIREVLLKRILDKNKIEGEAIKTILEYYRRLRQYFNDNLKRGIFEFFYIPELIKKEDLRLNMPLNLKIYYDKDDFKEHLNSIISEKNENYHIGIPDNPVISNSKVIKNGLGRLYIINFDQNTIYRYNHTELANQFASYLNRQMKKVDWNKIMDGLKFE